LHPPVFVVPGRLEVPPRLAVEPPVSELPPRLALEPPVPEAPATAVVPPEELFCVTVVAEQATNRISEIRQPN
jgi:hypothetical protein